MLLIKTGLRGSANWGGGGRCCICCKNIDCRECAIKRQHVCGPKIKKIIIIGFIKIFLSHLNHVSFVFH